MTGSNTIFVRNLYKPKPHTMRNAYILLLMVLLFGACSTSKTESVSIATPDTTMVTSSGFDENKYETLLDLTNYLASESPSDTEVQTIDSTCVIVINPSDEQLATMETEYGEDFYTIADDNSYYQAEASMKLDSFSIKTVQADQRFLKLKGTSETWIIDIRKDGAPEWNMILFHPHKKPEVVSSINVTEEKINTYFGN